MAKIINLHDLLTHEILDLYSAEEQIIEALPKMVEKANNAQLKTALNEHLNVTKAQKDRLDEVKKLLGEKPADEDSGFFTRLFGGLNSEKCKGTEGLIKEGEKMMAEDMTPQAMDAAIISAAQKIEHYEICGYGTAVAFAKELGLTNVASLLQETLDEEYFADNSLTALAVGKLNEQAEKAVDNKNSKSKGNSKSGNAQKSSPAKKKSTPVKNGGRGNSGKSSTAFKKSAPAKKSTPAKKSAPAKSSAAKASPAKGKSAAPGNSRGNTSRSNTSTSKNSTGQKSPAKKTAASKRGGGNTAGRSSGGNNNTQGKTTRSAGSNRSSGKSASSPAKGAGSRGAKTNSSSRTASRKK